MDGQEHRKSSSITPLIGGFQALHPPAGVVPLLSEQLVKATTTVAARSVRGGPIEERLSTRVRMLVRASLKGLAKKRRRSDTAFWLLCRLGEGGHGLSQ